MKMVKTLSMLAALATISVVVPACTADQKNTAKAVASAAIDAACDNLSNMDAQFAAVAPNANGAARAGYASAKAIIQSACDARPLATPEQRVAAVSAAVARIAGILAPLLANGG